MRHELRHAIRKGHCSIEACSITLRGQLLLQSVRCREAEIACQITSWTQSERAIVCRESAQEER